MTATATPTEPPERLDATHPVAGFLAARPPWWGDPGDDPVHPLPPDALDALAASQGRWPGLTAAAVEWEAGFTDRCAAHRLAGAWAGRPSASATLYASPLRPFSPAEITRLGWPPEVVRSLPARTRTHDDARERLDGVAGRLMTEPAFLADRDALRSGWRRLGDADRPPLPIARRPVSAGSPAGGTGPPSAAAAAFAATAAVFLDRWGLVRLATWDLPEPQGPAAPSGWRPPDHLAPSPGVHLYVPLAYPFPAADLLGQVRAAQRAEVERRGLPTGLGGVRHHLVYAGLLRQDHLERTVRRRFPGPPPRGLVAAVERAAGAWLDLNPATVRQRRKWLTACRRGDRHAVRPLAD